MASKQIHELSYRLTLNNKDFAKKMNATTAEVRHSTRVIKSAAKPIELLAIEKKKLQNLLKKDLINRRQYNDALAKTAQKLGVVTMATRAMNAAKIAAIASIGAATVAIYGLSRAIGHSMGEIDKFAKAARSINFPTQEFQVFERVASRVSGTTDQVFRKAMERMTVQIGDAASGTGEAAEAFKKLGLNANWLRNISADQAFLAIADAVQKQGNSFDKTEAVAAIFGQRAISLTNTLDLGSGALRDYSSEMRKLGGIMTEFQEQKVEAANDAIADMKDAFMAMSNEAAVTFSPAIEQASVAMRFGIPVLRDAWDRATHTQEWFDARNARRMAEEKQFEEDRKKREQQAAAERKKAEGEQARQVLMRATVLPKFFQKAGTAIWEKAQEDQMAAVGKLGNLFGNAGTNLTRGFINAQRARAAAAPPKDTSDPKAAGVFGPADSLTAGSSEAFRFLNRMGQEIPQQQLKEQKETNTKLGQLVDQFTAWVEFSQADRDKAADALFGNPT